MLVGDSTTGNDAVFTTGGAAIDVAPLADDVNVFESQGQSLLDAVPRLRGVVSLKIIGGATV